SSWDQNASDDVTTFLGLTDTPAAYTSSANYMVQVNGTANGLVFTDVSGWDQDSSDDYASWTVVADDTNTEAITTGTSVDFTGGSAITTSYNTTTNELTISHSDTSAQASSDNSGTTVIQDITLDDYGHLTGVGTVDMATALASTLDNYTSFNVDSDDNTPSAIESGDELLIAGGSNITTTNTGDTVTINLDSALTNLTAVQFGTGNLNLTG